MTAQRQIPFRITLLLLCLLSPCIAEKPKQKDLTFYLLEEVFPHIAVGGPWSTTIILMNVHAEETARTTILFFRPDGSPWPVTDSTGQTFVGYNVVLAPLNSVTLELPQTGGAIETGWAQVEQPLEGTIGGQAIFRDNGGPGRPIPFEAVIPLTSWGEGSDIEDFTLQYLPFDQTRGFSTCVAIANPSSFSPLEVVLLAVEEQVGLLEGPGTSTVVSLPAMGQTSFCLSQETPGLAGKRGYLVVGREALQIGVIGLRFGPQGSFTTLFPMSPLLWSTVSRSRMGPRNTNRPWRWRPLSRFWKIRCRVHRVICWLT